MYVVMYVYTYVCMYAYICPFSLFILRFPPFYSSGYFPLLATINNGATNMKYPFKTLIQKNLNRYQERLLGYVILCLSRGPAVGLSIMTSAFYIPNSQHQCMNTFTNTCHFLFSWQVVCIPFVYIRRNTEYICRRLQPIKRKSQYTDVTSEEWGSNKNILPEMPGPDCCTEEFQQTCSRELNNHFQTLSKN